MSADNHPYMNREIQALQQEQPRPDAKAELILELLKEKRETRMSVLKRATLPTLVSVAAIAGVFYVSQPKVMAATPEKVAKAIQEIKNYTIKSFTLNGSDRHLQSKTIVTGKDRKTVYYDEKGNETTSGLQGNVMMMGGGPANMGFKFDVKGDLQELSKEDIAKLKVELGSIELKGGGAGLPTKIMMNGKEIDKLPGNVQFSKQDIRVEVVKDKDGKEVKKYFVNGKQVDKLPEGAFNFDMKDLPKGTGGGAIISIGGKDIKPGDIKMRNSQSTMILGDKGGKPMMMQSGSTSADYLVDLLKDTDRWTIERGVTLNGQRLDKFTLKGPISPIVLYIDPATALPKVLQFATPFQEGATIEDVYEYSVQP